MSDPSTPRALDAKGVAGTVLCCALWGGNAVAVKFAITEGGLPPIGCSAMRFAISLPIVFWFCAQGGTGFRRPKRDWWLLGLHGLVTFIQIGTYNWGVSHSEAGRSSVFINVHPLVVAPMAWLVLGEHLGRRGVMGLCSAAIGVGLILAKQLRLGGGLEGDLVVLASGILFGLQTVAQKRTYPRIPPRTLLFYQTLIALPLATVWSLVFEGTNSYHFTRESVWGLLYQGIAVSGVCFSLWAVLLRRYPAGRLATIAFLTPLFGISLASLLRHEPLTWTLAFGGGLVGLGIYLVAGSRPEVVDLASSEGTGHVVDREREP